jgi:cyclopropane fatty-acyl-phospholipid synthase-like methyltransferase
MKDQDVPPHSQMMQYILGKWVSRPISLVARLGIADLMASGTRSVEDLADATGTHAGSLYRVMRALAGMGIFHEEENRQFSMTPLGECLKSDGLRYQAMLFHSEWHDRAWSELEHAVRTDESAFERAFGKSAFEWLAEHPEEARIHGMAMASSLGPRTAAIIQSFDFGEYNVIVDVGSGHGSLLVAIARDYPKVSCIAADLPHVVREAEANFEAAGLSDRCRAECCDIMKCVPENGDLYILSNILHDWNDDRSRTILENCRKAMKDNSKILIVEFLVPPANEFSPAKLLDIEMMVMSDGGRERTEDEFHGLLVAAGLSLENLNTLATGEVLLEAVISNQNCRP